MNPRTRYARRDGAAIAYQTHGEGPVDLVFLAGVISHIEHLWEDPALVWLFDRQAEFSRLILMDRRGTGLSDRAERAAGARGGGRRPSGPAAVLDAVGSERAALHAYSAAAPFAIQFATSEGARPLAAVRARARAGLTLRFSVLPHTGSPLWHRRARAARVQET